MLAEVFLPEQDGIHTVCQGARACKTKMAGTSSDRTCLEASCCPLMGLDPTFPGVFVSCISECMLLMHMQAGGVADLR